MLYKLSDFLNNERISPIETEDELHQIFNTIIGRIMKKISNDKVLEIFRTELETYGKTEAEEP